jgi:hypothetical protein
MARVLYCLIVALSPAVTLGQAADPLQSAACQQALRSVGEQEARAAAAQQVDPQAGLPQNRVALARLEASRQHAAQVCLGSQRIRPASRPEQAPRLVQPSITPPPSRPSSRTPG